MLKVLLIYANEFDLCVVYGLLLLFDVITFGAGLYIFEYLFILDDGIGF